MTTGDLASTRRSAVGVLLTFFIAYTLVVVVLTYPLVRSLTTRIPHDLGDPLLSTVILWWNAHKTPLSDAWWNGPFFFPAPGMLAFSDHRLGASLLATPLQWAGAGPVGAYNVTLLAMFPLCAIAAHAFVYSLTSRHDAAAVAGLAYGFNPYRFAHIEHLELLAAFGMPIALTALHRYLRDRRAIWLVVLAGALVLQALASTYYFLFFLVLMALWLVWFIRRTDLGALPGIAMASAAAAAALAPIALRFAAIHERYGLRRSINDIVSLSADVSSFVTASPLSTIWGWTSTLNGPERQLFPGATIIVLVIFALILRRQRSTEQSDGRRAAWVLGALSAIFAIVATSAVWLGPWRVGPLSVGTPFKPFSLAFLAAIGALLASSPVRDAYRRRSVFAFYVLACGALALFSLGPKPAFLHQQFLYEPPYAWLMQLGVFRDSVRVPARFGMLVALALSTAAALAFDRLAPRGSRVMLACVIAGVLADSWISGLPLLDPPSSWPAAVPRAGAASFLQLPLGDITIDIASMYRGMQGGVPTVNGNSGFEPPHYQVLRRALAARDDTALDALTAFGPMLVAVDRAQPRTAERLEWLRRYPKSKELWSDAESVWFSLDARPRTDSDCPDSTVPIVAIRDWWGPLSPGPLSDGRRETFWASGDSQQAGDLLLLDLGRVTRVCSVRLSLGSRANWYPDFLSVATSIDGESWPDAMPRRIGGLAVTAALEHPLAPAIELPVDGTPARYIRLRVETDQPGVPWIVTELAVTAQASQ